MFTFNPMFDGRIFLTVLTDGVFQPPTNRLMCRILHSDDQRGDWSRVFYPGVAGAVAGPDDEGHGVNWSLDGRAGDVWRGTSTVQKEIKRGGWMLEDE